MTYINKLSSFDEVAAWYAKTKPVVSKRHTLEEDVRPIGKRARKWERIIKVNDHCYALSCGGYADPVFNWGYTDQLKTHPLTTKDIALCSPIVWRKHKDGTETITVRNGPGEWQHNHIYSFISRALPRELWFRQTREGKQYIYNRAAGQTLHLPKTRTVPRHIVEHHKQRAAKNNTSWYAKRLLNAFQTGDDGLSVTFKRGADGRFTLVGEPHKVMVDRTRVNKDEKREFKPHIEALYEWAQTMYPMMRDQLNWSFRMEMNNQLNQLAKEHGVDGYTDSHAVLFVNAEKALVRAILKDPEHVMRYGLGVAVMMSMHDAERSYNGDKDDVTALGKHVRACFNRWINATAGFATKVKMEK
jgi:hypothetical protein